MRAAYVDASALVKLFKDESETEALAEALGAWPVWVSSELVAVEARCTARRLGGIEVLERAEGVLAALDLVGCAPEIRERAGQVFARPLRALDAIHAATILALGEELLEVVVVYDRDLRAAVEAEGMTVAAPAPS